eukprot:714675-Rhodomonas_salina.1
MWVDIDSDELEKIPQDVVLQALEERNRALPQLAKEREFREQKQVKEKTGKPQVPRLELKFCSEGGTLEHTPCPVTSPPASSAGWNDPDLVTPRGTAFKTFGRISSLGRTWLTRTKSNVHWRSSPKFSSSSPAGVFARLAANDEAMFRSAGKADAKIGTGEALLR